MRDAVTGRIDVRTGKLFRAYKASGIEWLVDLPDHWQVFSNGLTFRFGQIRQGSLFDKLLSETPPCTCERSTTH